MVALSCRNNATAFIGYFALLPSLSIIITQLRETYVGTSFLPTKALYSHNDICERYKVLLYVLVISVTLQLLKYDLRHASVISQKILMYDRFIITNHQSASSGFVLCSFSYKIITSYVYIQAIFTIFQTCSLLSLVI